MPFRFTAPPPPRRFARPPDDDLQARLHRVADRLEPAMRQAFLDAVAAADDASVPRVIAEAIDQGDATSALDATQWALLSAGLQAALPPILAEAVQRAAQVTAGALPASADIGIAFGRVNPQAVAWAEQHVAALVSQISTEQAASIRQIITQALSEGMDPRQAARLIRAVVGLTPRDAAALARYRAGLVASGTRPARVEDLVQAYRGRMIRARATLIARTELLQASNTGAQLLWQEAVAAGQLDPSEWRREWMTGGSRICPLCAALNGKKAPIGGAFPGGVSGPPRHPACRCTHGLVRRAA